MTKWFSATGRSKRLGAAAGVAVVLVTTAYVGAHSAGVGGQESRAPLAVPNASARPGREEVVAGVRYLVFPAAEQHLLPDTSTPREAVRLLWLDGRLAQPSARGSLVLDETGGVLEVDDRLRVRRPHFVTGGREISSVASAEGGGKWITTLGGEVLRFDASGAIVDSAPGASLGFASVASDQSGTRPWLVRSATRFAYRFDSAGPLLVRLGANGQATGVGRAGVPAHALLADLANAGFVAVAGDTVYYAPFIRDEVVAMRANGDTLWVASRELPQSTGEPRFELDHGKAVVNYHPVNLGVSIGPDGHLYVLSTAGFTTSESRLDVFDRHAGRLLRTAQLATALPSLAVAADGRTYLLDPVRLLTGTAPREREALAPIQLPLLSGGTMAVDSSSGKVTLVNVWASWCTPCRVEMPALDSLRRELADEPRFRFLTVNEDVRVAEARGFLAAFGFDFPVLLGGGKMKDRLHYPGLPYTLLLDGRGRIVQKWIGFAGDEQAAAIRASAVGELRRVAPSEGHAHSGHTQGK